MKWFILLKERDPIEICRKYAEKSSPGCFLMNFPLTLRHETPNEKSTLWSMSLKQKTGAKKNWKFSLKLSENDSIQ
jgi:hypothetical protein